MNNQNNNDDDFEHSPPEEEVVSPVEQSDLVQLTVRNEEEVLNQSKEETTSSTVTPLPWSRLAIVFIMHVCEVCALTTLLPSLGLFLKNKVFFLLFLVPLVKFFEITDDDRKIGYYAGLIASSFYCAQFFASIIWGLFR